MTSCLVFGNAAFHIYAISFSGKLEVLNASRFNLYIFHPFLVVYISNKLKKITAIFSRIGERGPE